jgi:4-hydroxybenzoyl-CoA thioesterase
MPHFERDIQVRFGDTDPAGIVFYPRYYEMVNQVVEDWFAHGLGYPFRRMHLEGRRGVPTVSIESVFQNPSRLGDILRFTLTARRIGTKSANLHVHATCDEEARLTCRTVIVHSTIGREVQAVPWPEEVSARMADYLAHEDDE